VSVETTTITAPTMISTPDARRDGVVLCEVKFCPCRSDTERPPITATASNHPTTNAIPLRRPAGIVSKMITVTTDTGLQRATAKPRPRTVRIRVCSSGPSRLVLPALSTGRYGRPALRVGETGHFTKSTR
jgi:hypothetical protein